MGHLEKPCPGSIYLALFDKLLSGLQRRHPSASKSLARDAVTLRSRFMAEGLGFLTKTLPKLGKAFDRSLETGTLEVPREFKRAHEDRTIPAFLQGMFRMCYSGGRTTWPICPDVIRDIRQVCFLLYKLELPYPPEVCQAVLDRFQENEDALRCFDFDPEDDITIIAHGIVAELLDGLDHKDVQPKHGPGAVATGEKYDEKWVFTRLYDSIHQVYPYYDYFMVGGRACLLDSVKHYKSLTRMKSGCAKVVLVPKDSRGPRLISCEPLEYQWIQQGVNRLLVSRLQSHRLSRGQINFDDQSVNGGLARVSSRFGYYSTLDLKDASDRVSMELIRMLFPSKWIRVLSAIRSTHTELPDGKKIALAKHAPMGSAVCFSVEALCFWAISVAAVVSRRLDRYSSSVRSTHLRSLIEQASSEVYVYGDDLIVPSTCFTTVCEALANHGLLVNVDKCYHDGPFRESCGIDAYDGVDVTPTKVSTLWSHSPRSANCLASWCSYANDFEARGYHELSAFVWEQIEDLYGEIPFGIPTSGYPHRCVPSYDEAVRLNIERMPHRVRWNKRYQKVEVWAKTLKSMSYSTSLDSWERLLRNLTQGCGDRPDLGFFVRRTKIASRYVPC